MCGLAPSRVLGALNYGAGGWEHASVRMLATGKVEVITGTSPHGQGHETAWSQIAADRLGVPVRGHRGAARRHRRSRPDGTGHLRVPLAGGRRRGHRPAADKVIEKAKVVAAHLLEASADDLEFSNGRFTVRGTDNGIGITEIATAQFTSHNLPAGFEPGIDADANLDPDDFSFPHGTHLCAVEVDTETGQTTMRKYVCVDDVGQIINPLIVEGQVHGGLLQGIAQALWEEAVFDDQGTLVTGSFVDYTLPTAADTIGELRHGDTPRLPPPPTPSAPRASARPAPSPPPRPSSTRSSTPCATFGVTDVQMPCTPSGSRRPSSPPGP